MGIVSRIKDRFTKTDNALPVGYPRVTTRISRDEDQIGWQEINAMLRSVSAIAAKFPFQVYQYLDDLFLVDPYMAKYHQTTIALGNTGHQIEIVAENENKAKAANITSRTISNQPIGELLLEKHPQDITSPLRSFIVKTTLKIINKQKIIKLAAARSLAINNKQRALIISI